jgi:hypothetical protein
MKLAQAPFIVIILFPVVTPDGGVNTGNGFRAGVKAMSPDDISEPRILVARLGSSGLYDGVSEAPVRHQFDLTLGFLVSSRSQDRAETTQLVWGR